MNNEKNTIAIVGFILALISILLILVAPLALVLAIVAIILSALGLRKITNKGLAVAGLVMGIVSGLISLVMTIILVIGLVAFKSTSESLRELNEKTGISVQTSVTTKQATEYGEFELPPGWEKLKQYSSEKKLFFIPLALADQKAPFSNISVETGSNRYGVDEHEQFRMAILRQLSMQSQGEGKVEQVTGSGSYTEDGDVLYTFEIKDEDSTTTQYYIVGDKKYVLVQVTDFHEPEEVDLKGAAMQIINSFNWD